MLDPIAFSPDESRIGRAPCMCTIVGGTGCTCIPGPGAGCTQPGAR